MSISTLAPRPDDPTLLPRLYRAALAAQADFGLSTTAFAGRIGISPSTLYLWRRRQFDVAYQLEAEPKAPSGNSIGLLEARVSMPFSCAVNSSDSCTAVDATLHSRRVKACTKSRWPSAAAR